jgi:GGDEF domain-containing protein
MDIRIKNFDAFKEVYGFVAGDDVLRFTAMLLGEVVDEVGTVNDFIGHPGGDNFIVITSEQCSPQLCKRLKERFAEEVLSHYSFIDREQGFVINKNADGKEIRSDLMTLAIGEVSPSRYEFSDIREITELAAEERRKDG